MSLEFGSGLIRAVDTTLVIVSTWVSFEVTGLNEVNKAKV